ncbi:MAG: EAL domain-containing protein, partial [Cyanobacteria bacterium P01_C01_bin.73]
MSPPIHHSDSDLSWLSSLPDIIIVVDEQGKVVFCNRALDHADRANIFLLTTLDPKIVQNKLFSRERNSLSASELPLSCVLAGDRIQNLELLLIHQAQHQWVSISGSSLPEGGAIFSIRDITAHKQTEADQQRHTLYDPLTGLPNDSLFIDRLSIAISHSQEPNCPLMAILYIDIDRLAVINASLGHTTGDRLLKAFSSRLRQAIGPSHTLARLGEDEFIILLENISACSTAIAMAETLQSAISQPFKLDPQTQSHQELYVTASIGIALGPTGYPKAEIWLRDASTAMYQAKTSPEDCWCVFDSSIQMTHNHRLQVEMDLRRAIANNELRLHYQPIVAIRDRKLLGFEALVRWQHPTRGLLMPGKFIDIAEKTGLIVPLGWWVLHEACRQMQHWRSVLPESQSLKISVNVSSQQFAQDQLISKVEAILKDTRFPPEKLTLEITEGVLIEHSASIISTLKALQALGIQFSIDD